MRRNIILLLLSFCMLCLFASCSAHETPVNSGSTLPSSSSEPPRSAVSTTASASVATEPPTTVLNRKAYAAIDSADAWNAFVLDFSTDRAAYAESVIVQITAPLDFSDKTFLMLAHPYGIDLRGASAPSETDSLASGAPGFYHISAGVQTEQTPSTDGAGDSYRCADLVFEDCRSPIAFLLPEGDITIENIVARRSVQLFGNSALPTGAPSSFRQYTLRNIVIDGELNASARQALLAFCDARNGNLLYAEADALQPFYGFVRSYGGLLMSDLKLAPGSTVSVSGITVRNAAVCSWAADPEDIAYDCAGLLCGWIDAADGTLSFSNIRIENCFGYGVSVAALSPGILFRDALVCQSVVVSGCDLTSPFDLTRQVQTKWTGISPALLRRASQSSDLLVRRMPQSLYQRWLVDARFSDCRICVPELPVGTISAEWNGMTLERCENLRQAIAYETP